MVSARRLRPSYLALREIRACLPHPTENNSQDSSSLAKTVRKSPGDFCVMIARARITEKGSGTIGPGRGNRRGRGDSQAVRTFMVNDPGCGLGS